MDTIFLKGLKVDAFIGVYAWEQRIRQTLWLDIDLVKDLRQAGQSDNLSDTLDYSAVAGRLEQLFRDQHFQLIETAAEHCAALLMQEFPVTGCRIRLSKPGAVPAAETVGVQIERGGMPRG